MLTRVAAVTFFAVSVTCVEVGSLSVMATFSLIQYAVAPAVRLGTSTTSLGIWMLRALDAKAEFSVTSRSTVSDRISGTNAAPVVEPVEP